MNISKFYTTTNVGDLLHNLGLYEQWFDYRQGYYNKDNQLVCLYEDSAVKCLFFDIFHRAPYLSPNKCVVIYMPFFFYINDKKIDIEFGDYSYDK